MALIAVVLFRAQVANMLLKDRRIKGHIRMC